MNEGYFTERLCAQEPHRSCSASTSQGIEAVILTLGQTFVLPNTHLPPRVSPSLIAKATLCQRPLTPGPAMSSIRSLLKCHLLIYAFPESENKVLVTQSCLRLCNPKGCSPPGSSVRGISQARILEWVAIFFSKGSILIVWVPWSSQFPFRMQVLEGQDQIGCPHCVSHHVKLRLWAP